MVGIKNMEVPTSCVDCDFACSKEGYMDVPCLISRKDVFEYTESRPDDCPLVEVEDKMIVRKEVCLCKNPSGNKYCDYTQQDKKKQCNYEERCGASYLDCQFCLKVEEITKVSIK